MTSKVYVVTDLGPGDGGKGGVVHKVATMAKAHTVIKRGGAQGSHGVCTAAGESFCFSQWGCGTLEGIPTFVSEQMVISPMALMKEAEALRRDCGINDAFRLLSVDENCICATPYHGISSRIKELARGKSPRGTIGTGVGEAYRYSLSHPDLTIRVKDLFDPNVADKLETIAYIVKSDLESLIAGDFLSEDAELLAENVELLYDDGFLSYCLRHFVEVAQHVRVARLEEILAKPGTAVVESSHGVLTDSEAGLKPHTSAIRTLPCFTEEMLRNAGFAGRVFNLGIHRAYSIRHGAGPLPTHDPDMSEKLLPGSNKVTNRWQGEVRVGPLDIPLLKYAIDLCGGPSTFDGLCITWFDQIIRNGVWRYCAEYSDMVKPQAIDGDITRELFVANPIISELPITQDLTPNGYFDIAERFLSEHVGVPVKMVSLGPTELDKIISKSEPQPKY